MRAPDKLLHLQWVKKAWESVTIEVIINSFKVCGISVETDGTEDGLVHCINLEGWQLMPQQRSCPRQPHSLLANNTAQYCTACMSHRTVRSAENMCNMNSRLHTCTLLLNDIDPLSFCTHILAGT